MTDLYDRTTDKPTSEQVQALWSWLVALRNAYPDRQSVEGAYHAAEWVLGLTNVMPVSGRILYNPTGLLDAAWAFGDEDPYAVAPATVAKVLEEYRYATALSAPGRDDIAARRARGVNVFLAWWLGAAALPDWLIPNPRKLPARRGAA